MTTVADSPRPKKKNRLGLSLIEYKGNASTLCKGCGHDAITSQLIKALFEYGVEPHRVIKMSGIGCSSKTPAYFLSRSHGFNGVHGRMPSLATGAVLANTQLLAVGVTGDGDSASIGLGQFCHLLRRNVPMLCLVENNGVYGLTKGQFSATADYGSKLKTGVVNDLPAIDLCSLAIEMGCAFVARSFAGDPKQLVNLIKAALAHRGTALLDIISPCVTFNNHEGSTKSYKHAKETEDWLHEIGFVPFFDPITVDYEEGSTREIEMHDGSRVVLKKLDKDYDPTDRFAALHMLREAQTEGELLTGLVYVDPKKKDFLSLLHLVDEPLATLPVERVRPSREKFQEIMGTLM